MAIKLYTQPSLITKAYLRHKFALMICIKPLNTALPLTGNIKTARAVS